MSGRLNSVDWNGGLEWWTGLVEWTSGMDQWNGLHTPKTAGSRTNDDVAIIYMT